MSLFSYELKYIGFALTLLIGAASLTFTDRVKALDALETPSELSEESVKSLFLDSTSIGSRLLVVGERGHILYSDDGGESWIQADVPVTTTLTSVFFVDHREGWVVGHDTVALRTTDAGETWLKVLDGYKANDLVLKAATRRLDEGQELDEVSRDELDFLEFALDEATRDEEIGPNKVLMDVWFNQDGVGLVVGAAGYMLRTEDAGASWKDWSHSIANINFLHHYGIEENTEGTLFIVGEAGNVYRSFDTGLTWESVSVPYEGSLFGAVSDASNNDVYLYGMDGTILRSSDNGNTWASLETETRTILQNAAIGPNGSIAAVGLGGVLVVKDNSSSAFRLRNLGTRSALTSVVPLQGDRLVVTTEQGLKLFSNTVDGGEAKSMLSTPGYLSRESVSK